MAPQVVTSISEASPSPSQTSQILMQATQRLQDAVREYGPTPSPFASALLELIENTAKINEFDEMAAAANQEATSEEAKSWREISLMTLQFCRAGLAEQQKKGVEKACELAKQGGSIYQPQLPQAAEVSQSPPPGVWAPSRAAPPPGLAAPAQAPAVNDAVGAPPGLSNPPCEKKTTPPTSPPLPPWRRPKAKSPQLPPVEPEPKPQAPAKGNHWSALNLDAYDSDSD